MLHEKIKFKCGHYGDIGDATCKTCSPIVVSTPEVKTEYTDEEIVAALGVYIEQTRMNGTTNAALLKANAIRYLVYTLLAIPKLKVEIEEITHERWSLTFTSLQDLKGCRFRPMHAIFEFMLDSTFPSYGEIVGTISKLHLIAKEGITRGFDPVGLLFSRNYRNAHYHDGLVETWTQSNREKYTVKTLNKLFFGVLGAAIMFTVESLITARSSN